MRIKYMLGALSAVALMGSPALAQSTAGGGVAASGPEGSVAGGATAGTARQPDHSQSEHGKKMKQHRGDRADRAADRAANSSSTYGAGSVYTDRDRATGAVTSGGSASGSGPQSSSTAVDAYGSTTTQGSDAEVYGDSTASSGQQKPN